MGNTFSFNKEKIANNILEGAYNSCPNVGSVNITNLDDVTINPSCDNSVFVVGQWNKLSASCLIESLQKAIATSASKLNAKTAGGLGLTVSRNVEKTQNNIDSMVKSQCGYADVSGNFVNMKDVEIGACKTVVVQDATANQACQINTLQNMASTVSSGLASRTKGISITLMVIVIVIVLLIVLGVGGYFIYKKSKENPEATSAAEKMALSAVLAGGSETNGWCLAVVIIILVFLILLAFGISRAASRKKINEVDVDILVNNIDEAHKIADAPPRINHNPIGYDNKGYMKDNFSKHNSDQYDDFSQHNPDQYDNFSKYNLNQHMDNLFSSNPDNINLEDFYKPLTY